MHLYCNLSQFWYGVQRCESLQLYFEVKSKQYLYIKHTHTKKRKKTDARTYAVFAIQRQLEPLLTGTSIAAFGIDAVMYTAAIFVETFIFI